MMPPMDFVHLAHEILVCQPMPNVEQDNDYEIETELRRELPQEQSLGT
jgi:hypothetical protein